MSYPCWSDHRPGGVGAHLDRATVGIAGAEHMAGGVRPGDRVLRVRQPAHHLAVIGLADIGRSDRQRRQEGAQQRPRLAFVDAPHGARSACRGDVPSGKRGRIHELRGGLALASKNAVFRARRFDVPIGTVEKVETERTAETVLRHVSQETSSSVSAHSASGIDVRDRGIFGFTDKTSSVMTRVHRASGIGVRNSARVGKTDKTSSPGAPAHSASGIGVGDRALNGSTDKASNIVTRPRHSASGVDIRDRGRLDPSGETS